MANSKKAQTKAQTRVEMLDRLLDEVDPEVLLAGSLGAIAAAGGITPPLTRMLMAIGTNGSGLADDYKTLLIAGTGIGPIWAVASHLFLEQGNTTAPPTNVAIAASGALEAMLMMTLVKNPATIEAIGNAVGKASTGIGAIL